MSTKALKKELLVAVVMLLVAAVALSGSTYAWFAVNNAVTVTGLEVTTQVSNNLYVADTTFDATNHVADANFARYLHKTAASPLLEPVSTVNGIDFFYTNAKTNVGSVGQALTSSYIVYNASHGTPTAAELSAFVNNNTITGSKGFFDYVFELKAVNGKDGVAKLALTKLNLTYKGLQTTERAWRVAVFMEKLDGTYKQTSPELLQAAKSLYKRSDAAYFTDNQAVSGVNALSNVLTLGTGINLDVAAKTTEYYKVIVRMWLEGEDTTCKNDTYAELDKGWALDLKFELDPTANKATAIGTPAINAVLSNNNLTSSVWLSDGTGANPLPVGSLSNGEMPASYKWFKADTPNTVVSTASSYTVSDPADYGVYVCEVTTELGNVYYTTGQDLKPTNP